MDKKEKDQNESGRNFEEGKKKKETNIKTDALWAEERECLLLAADPADLHSVLNHITVSTYGST